VRKRLILARARHYGPVLLTPVLGAVLATALLASGPILVDTALDLSLQRAERAAGSGTLGDALTAHLRLETTLDPGAGPGRATAYRELDARVAALVQTRMRSVETATGTTYVARIIPSGETRWASPWMEGEPDPKVQDAADAVFRLQDGRLVSESLEKGSKL